MNNKLVIEQAQPSNDRHRYSSKFLQVYVPSERPFENGKILEDLAWRRNHEKPNHLKPFVAEAIKSFLADKDHTLDDVTIVYDRYCGCSMCPCSPGFVVRSKKRMSTMRFDIWLDWNKTKGEIVLDKKTSQYEIVV